jgi:hypothetical protein
MRVRSGIQLQSSSLLRFYRGKTMDFRRFMNVSLMSVLLSGALPLKAAPIDSMFFTTYTLSGTNVLWEVCSSYGCPALGSLGSFGRVGAMLEGNPVQSLKKGTVTRDIYVLDLGYGSSGNEVALYTYQKVDTPTPGGGSGDTVTVKLLKTVVLPLTGGSATVASMAANSSFLFIGTNQDQQGVEVKKSNFAVTQFGVTSGQTVTGMTIDAYGYATVISGSGTSTGFVILGPNGVMQLEGGGPPSGPPFVLNTIQAVIPSTLP